MAFEFMSTHLQEREKAALLRQPVVIERYQKQHIRVSGQDYINFSSNDYLGLAQSPALLAKVDVASYSTGSGGSPLVTGHSYDHQALIDYVCEKTNRETGLLCSSGFAANFAILQALIKEDSDMVLMDKLAHASMIDGALASGGKLQRFRHNDTEHLNAKLAKANELNILVATEGVFSMDGDIAPVVEIAQLCQQKDALLMVDDAHAIGVLGQNGFGHADVDGVSQQQLPVWMATFGKAVGTGGAIICGSKTLISYLNNFARHYIYSTAMSPLQAAITLNSLQMLNEEHWRREKLQQLIAQFRHGAANIGLTVQSSETAIQPVIIGDPERALAISEKLKNNGFWVSAIRAPTVPLGTDRLRITLTAHHESSDIDALLHCIEEVAQ